MRVLWFADIHLNFLSPEAVERFLGRAAAKKPDVVLIAGDIGEADTLFDYLGRFHAALEAPIFFVLGNHDYYHGSIEYVRVQLPGFLRAHPRLCWLSASEVVSLSPATGLVGHDSWGDGRLGDYWNSRVVLNDFALISELAFSDKAERLSSMLALGDQAARHFERVIPPALERHRRVIVLTHVPPFAGAAWFRGRPSDQNYLPFFACQAAGEALLVVMQRYQDREALVLCGHSHGAGVYQPLPNLTVITAAAQYGKPRAQKEIQID